MLSSQKTYIIEKHTKLPRSRIKQKIHKPWITDTLLNSIRNKQKMYRMQLPSKDLDKVAYYKKYSDTLNKLKWTCKSSNYKQQFELNKNNPKNTWKLIGTIINRKPKGHTVPANGKTYTDKHDIVNQFNEYFINIRKKFGIDNSFKYKT